MVILEWACVLMVFDSKTQRILSYSWISNTLTHPRLKGHLFEIRACRIHWLRQRLPKIRWNVVMYFQYHFMITSDFSSSFFFGFDLHFCHVFIHFISEISFLVAGVHRYQSTVSIDWRRLNCYWKQFASNHWSQLERSVWLSKELVSVGRLQEAIDKGDSKLWAMMFVLGNW